VAEFRTRFGLGETVYILDKDARNPEPVIISDIRIHAASYCEISYGVTYRGITDARQKDFKEQELGTLSEVKRLYMEAHIEELTLEAEVRSGELRVGDLPTKTRTKEELDHFRAYPPQFRP